MAKSDYIALGIDEKLPAIAGWVKNGDTEEEIAKRLGVTLKCFNEWKKGFPKLADTLKKDAEIADGELVETAFKQATGYYAVEDEAFKIKTYEEINGKMQAVEKVEIVSLRRYIQPNNTMNMFMLKNRVDRYSDDKRNKVDKVVVKTELEGELEEFSI